LLTRRVIGVAEPNLEWVHDALGVGFVVNLFHSEAISVLDSAVAKGKAEHSSKLSCGDVYHHLGQYYRLELAQARHGPEVGQLTL